MHTAPSARETHSLRLAELYRDHRGYVRRSLRSLRVPEAGLDDALHDVFVVVHRRLCDYSASRGSMRAWLFGIALRVAWSYRRRLVRDRCAVGVDSVADPATGGDPERYAARSEACEILDRLLSALPSEQWQVFVLAECEGLTGPEISDEIGVPLATVYTRLHRSRKRLHRELRRHRGLDRWALPAFLAPLRELFGAPAVLRSAAFVSVSALRAAAIVAVLGVVALLWWKREAPRPIADDEPAAAAAPLAEAPRTRATVMSELHALELRATTGSVAGHVRRTGGGAVSGARVCAWSRAAEPGGPTEAVACATSERDGHYRIAGLAPQVLQVTATAPGSIPGQHHAGARTDVGLQLRPGAELLGVDIELEGGGAEVRGVVHDMSGGVVDGARVQLRGATTPGLLDPHAAFLWGNDPPAEVVTGPDGSFTAWVRPGALAWSARADGYAPGQGRGAAPTVAGHELRLHLAPAAVLIGRVVDLQTRAPIAGLRVSAEIDGAGLGQPTSASAVSDGAGKFRIDGLMPGRYKPRATGPGQSGLAPRSVLLGMGETSDELEIEVRPAAIVRGVVLAEGSREPCPAGWVVLTDTRQYLGSASADIQPDGSVLLAAVMPGEYQVSVLCRGYTALASYPALSIAQADAIEGLVWTVQLADSLRGTVRDERGRPVARAEVRVDPKLGDGESLPRGGSSDEAGNFEIPGVAPGDYTLRASDPLHPDSNEVTVAVVAGTPPGPIDLVVRAGPQLGGSVHDGDGRPLSGVVVTASEWSLGTHAAMTDARGQFTLTHMRPGTYSITAERDGYTLGDGPGPERKVGPDETRPLDLVLTRAHGRIAGKVRGPDGAPVTDAFVLAARERPGQSAAFVPGDEPVLTDLDGRFQLTGLEPGDYTVRAYRRGGGEARREHVAPGSELTLSLPRDTSLAGQVLAAGQPAQAFEIEAIHAALGTARSEHFLSGAGAWALHDLAPGPYTVVARSPQGRASLAIEVADGESLTGLTLSLLGRVPITGRVVDLATQAPIAGALVIAEAQEDGIGRLAMAADVSVSLGTADPRQTTDAGGRFTLPGAPPGPVFLLVLPKGFPAAAHRIAITNTKATPGAPEVGDIPLVAAPPPGAVTSAAGFTWAGDPGQPAEPGKVASVAADGPAARAGLRPGDEVVAIDGAAISGLGRGHLRELLVRGEHGEVDKRPGAALALTLADGRTIQLTTRVLPAAAPEPEP